MSETRKRVHQINVRLLPDEFDALQAAAEREHVSPSEFLRRALPKGDERSNR